jgi:hypothetical protein
MDEDTNVMTNNAEILTQSKWNVRKHDIEAELAYLYKQQIILKCGSRW